MAVLAVAVGKPTIAYIDTRDNHDHHGAEDVLGHVALSPDGPSIQSSCPHEHNAGDISLSGTISWALGKLYCVII